MSSLEPVIPHKEVSWTPPFLFVDLSLCVSVPSLLFCPFHPLFAPHVPQTQTNAQIHVTCVHLMFVELDPPCLHVCREVDEGGRRAVTKESFAHTLRKVVESVFGMFALRSPINVLDFDEKSLRSILQVSFEDAQSVTSACALCSVWEGERCRLTIHSISATQPRALHEQTEFFKDKLLHVDQ
jgi:RNase P/RNase MRP subunit POP5